MNIFAIDPGNELSAFVSYNAASRAVVAHGKLCNADMLKLVRSASANILVIEQIASFGMAVGAEVFETVFWSGRFAQAWELRGGTWDRMKRMAVKMCLCHDSRAKDPNIRQALIDLFGPGKEKAIGKKHSPGPLFGIAGDEWSALAVAVTWAEKCNVHGARSIAV